jgi:hypothetical protein
MSRKEQAAWIITGTALTAFILLQFLPVWWVEPSTNLSNPPILADIHWDSPETAAMMERACYMCHSNETRLPIYMQVAPLSWIAAQRVNDARAHLNFSEQSASQISVVRVTTAIENGTMPPAQYLLLHPEAQLDEAEKARLVAGIRATFAEVTNQYAIKQRE